MQENQQEQGRVLLILGDGKCLTGTAITFCIIDDADAKDKQAPACVNGTYGNYSLATAIFTREVLDKTTKETMAHLMGVNLNRLIQKTHDAEEK